MRRKNFKSVRRFETLENRWMMAADINLNEVDDVDVLSIQGTNNDDWITIETHPNDADKVLVTVKDRLSGQVLDSDDPDRDEIDVLEVYALDGNDWIFNSTDIPGNTYGGNDTDVIWGGSADDWIYGEGSRDVIRGGAGSNHLEGGAGNDDYEFYTYSTAVSDVVVEAPSLDTDSLDFAEFDAPIDIDLAITTEQVVNAGRLTLRLSSATGIEDVIGSGDNDTIRGNSRDNRFYGYSGDDDLFGREGNDRLEGWVGNDDLDGGAGNDTYVLRSFSNGNSPSIYSIGLDRILNEAANADTDTLDFTGFAPNYMGLGVSANLAVASPQYAVNSQHLQLTLSNSTAIENVIGSAFSDTITGNSRPNHLQGGGEDDDITGAGADDKLEGGSGDDTYHFAGSNLGTDEIIEGDNADNDGLRFSGMSYGFTIDLTKFGSEYAVNVADLKVKLASDTAIERVWGTDYTDTIIGNSRDNHLMGRKGNDTIRGGIGADYMHGGDDNDTLVSDAYDEVYGGTGYDTFDEYREIDRLINPRRTRYLDWRVF